MTDNNKQAPIECVCFGIVGPDGSAMIDTAMSRKEDITDIFELDPEEFTITKFRVVEIVEE